MKLMSASKNQLSNYQFNSTNYVSKNQYISIYDLPKVPKEIFQTIQSLEDVLNNQFISYSLKVSIKSEIESLKKILNYQLLKSGYSPNVIIIPF